MMCLEGEEYLSLEKNVSASSYHSVRLCKPARDDMLARLAGKNRYKLKKGT